MTEEMKRLVLSKAAANFGVLPLAKHLNVHDGQLAAWISGHASMPDRKLLPLIDLIEADKESGE